MDTVNQFYSRHTYDTLLKKLGIEEGYKNKILERGYGYEGYVNNFRLLLDKLKIKETAKTVELLGDLLFNDYQTLFDNVADSLSKLSGINKRLIMEAFEYIKLNSTAYIKKLQQLF